MNWLLDGLVLAVGVALLFTAALRVAFRVAERGLPRLLAAATFACAAATIEVTTLGSLSLGASRILLVGLALVSWLASRICFPNRGIPLASDFVEWIQTGDRTAVVLAGGAFGFVLAVFIPALVLADIGFDNIQYHYVEVAAWVVNGDSGSVPLVNYDFPVGSYPLGVEVLMSWAATLAPGFGPLALVSIAGFALLILGLSSLISELGTGRLVGALVVSGVVLSPWLATEGSWSMGGAFSLGWLAVAAMFGLGAKKRAPWIFACFVACGLAVGSKTTVLVPTLALLMWVVCDNRVTIREGLRWIAPGLTAGLLLGGFWPMRTLIQHGWFFWPLQSVPWGDPVPPMFRLISPRFIERPIATLTEQPDLLLQFGGGTLVLVAFGWAGLLVSRARPVIGLTAVYVIATAAWVSLGGTGIIEVRGPLPLGPLGFVLSELRYLQSAALCAALALGVAGSVESRERVVPIAVLACSCALSLCVNLGVLDPPVVADVFTGNPIVSAPVATLGLVLAGGTIFLLAASAGKVDTTIVAAPSDRGDQLFIRGFTVIASVVALSVAVAFGSSGFTDRRVANAAGVIGDAGSERSASGDTLLGAFARQPAWRDGTDRISIASRAMVSYLAGDRLLHPLELIPRDEECERVRKRAMGGWVVVAPKAYLFRLNGISDYSAPACFKGIRPLWTGAHGIRIYRLDSPAGGWVDMEAS